MKKILIALPLLIVIVVAIFTFIQINNTTNYQEAISLMLDEDEKVTSIEIDWRVNNEDEGYVRKSATITDENAINRILEEPSEMKLKRKSKLLPGTEYNLFLTTNKGNKGIVFGDGNAQIGDEFYKITGDNLLKEVIENEDLEWKEK
ncbi:hypothetical protein [Ferdinandcohnia sp. SAFN-114]|uniref:hypothetical protein n=1 Tax=Ferdinandcohnia sp. SAFN-114 TaxID=3387275 RepID=UPI003F7D6716